MKLASHAHRPSSTQLLARILETPALEAQVRALPAPALARLVDRVGLADAGEIVALATTEQLAQVFDEDLWKSERAGEDPRFDADRFALWLGILREAGDAFVAEKLVELPPDLVTLAFHRQMLVLDLDTLRGEIEETPAIEKALESTLWEEIDEYQLVARRHDGWDDVLAAILALDRDHHDFLVEMLERCRAMTMEHLEDDGGLYEALTSEEMLEADVAAEREDRRAEQGHVAPSAAAAFLKLASTCEGLPADRDPLTRAYFRELAKEPAPAPRPETTTPSPELVRALREAEVLETPDAPRLPPAKRAREERLIVRAMRRLAREDPKTFFARSEELAYLANVLAAGCEIEGRRLRPIEAVRAATATCDRGLALAAGGESLDAAVRALREHPADALFRAAWPAARRDLAKLIDQTPLRSARIARRNPRGVARNAT